VTINNVTFGNGTDTVSGSIKEYIPPKFQLLFNTMSKVVSSGAVQEVDTKGVDWTCTVVQPCSADVGWAQDYDRWPVGAAQAPTKMRVAPVQITAKVALGLAASDVQLSVRERAEYVESQITARLKQMAMHLARGIFGGTVSPVAAGLGAWTSTAANGTSTVSFNDISLFKEGAGYDYIKASNGLSYVVRVQSITRAAVGSNSANVAGNVTFINDVPNPATGSVVALDTTVAAIGDVFRQRGSTAGFGGAGALVNRVLTSYSDLEGTGSLQGFTSATLPGWSGNTQALAAAYSQEAISALAGRIEAVSGEAPTHYFCSPQLLRAHGASFQIVGSVFGTTGGLSAATPRGIAASADKYGGTSEFSLMGKPLMADISCPATTIVCHNQDHVKLAKWSEVKAIAQGGTTQLLDQTFVANGYFLNGRYQMVCDQRSSIGTLTGITGL